VAAIKAVAGGTLRARARVLPGRIRAEVTGLRGDPAFARRLERLFARRRGVSAVSASPVTGRALVLFDPRAIDENTVLDALGKLESAHGARDGQKHSEHLMGVLSPPPQTPLLLIVSVLQPVVVGVLLVGIGINVTARGHTGRARSEGLNALSAFLGVLNGYPPLRRMAQAAAGPGVPVDTIERFCMIAVKAYRESLLGLAADFGTTFLSVLDESASWHARRKTRHLAFHARRVRLRMRDGKEISIPASELQPGEVVHIDAGDPVPGDGVVEEGVGWVDERALSPRALLTRKGPGDTVVFGTSLEQGSLIVRLTATGTHTRLGRLMERSRPVPHHLLPPDITRAVSRMSTGGIATSVATLLLTWSWRRALAVLVTFNPSGLAQSTLAASGAAVEAAAAADIRVQRRGIFDPLARVDTVLFTEAALTAASPIVDAVVPVDRRRPEAVLALAASALRHSTHPFAVPVLEKASELELQVPDVTDAEDIDGHGVRARDGSAEVLVGDALVLRDHGIPLEVARAAHESMEARGNSILFVAREGRLLGLIGLRERPVAGAREAAQGLRSAGIAALGVLSGDRSEATSRLAAELGIERTWNGLDPDAAAAVVRSLRRSGRVVAVVGAEAGDMLAMSQADVSIGLVPSGWTPLAHASHVVMPHGRLSSLPGLVGLARKVRAVFLQHLALTQAVSMTGGLGAVAGLLPFALADQVNNWLLLALLVNARRLSIVTVEEPVHPGARLPARGPAWHAFAPQDVARLLATDADTGLSAPDAALRLRRYGPNMLREAASPSFGALFIGQLGTGMTLLLGGAAVASTLISETLNAALIAGVVLLNAGLGAVQEYRAERAMTALRQYVSPTARCRRDGRLQLIPATQLVSGDLVLLQAGDTVPADSRVIESYACEVDEAILTGEAMPVRKSADPVRPDADLAERTSMVYMGTAVTAGRARVIVVATGMHTAVGTIAGLLENGKRTQTPLQTRLVTVSHRLAAAAGLGGAVFVGAGLLRRLPVSTLVMGSVSLVTAAVPEGLPAIVTIALSAAVQRMSRRSIIVRRLSAIETLGRVTVICCDKTGTLTQNRMAVRAIATDEVVVEGELTRDALARDGAIETILTIGAVCNDAALVDWDRRQTIGGRTEGALLLAAADAGLDVQALRREYERVVELPFATERAFMAVVCRHPQRGLVAFLKGAPETIIEACDRRRVDDRILPLDAAARDHLLRLSDQMAYDAMRVLGTAYLPLQAPPAEDWLERPAGCIFAGLVGMTDPLRPEVREAVERCEAAGVRVVMATGDHRSTAIAIARQLGLPFGRDTVLEGRDLAALSEEDLVRKVSQVRVFARVTPEHKLRIITAMQSRGEIVAMTGDGVNDAPAVKRADVGIAMGRSGTEVTRQASSLVLGDDSFVSIVQAIEEGRGVRRNLRRAIGYLLGGNLGETLFVVGATLVGGEMPLLPLHVLLVNLFTDALPVMALAGLPSPPGLLERPPMEELFDRGFYRDVVRRGLATGIATSVIYGTGVRSDPAAARSVAFAGLVASQLVQAQNWRNGGESDAFFTASLALSWAALGGILILPPLQGLFGTARLGVLDWARVLGVSVATDWLLRSRIIIPEPGTRLAGTVSREGDR
jgi:P-type Ca2+ transporter type 2C